ncbi:hypothetical protein [Polaribacter sp. Hel1_85]|uniref:hypothetical protein n=1 Tax=Polaribacter sp. Hel1_85 TaxID=1250005 RepID=UPI00052B837E|nr:hypothetical protein [Polaribacter sp. Hel1_85]KGL64167.1 hypothetical protein PHEL85_1219 [Polaribacter sp. Hel1_85]
MKQKVEKKNIEEISRKEAIQKIGNYGKYAALTALGTYLLLNPKSAQAASLEAPGDGF